MCRILLSKGADIGRQDNLGQTPLHLAVQGGSKSLVKTLLKDSNPNVKNVAGRTALFQAVEDGDKVMTKTLLDAMVDVNTKDASGVAPLHLAAEKGSESIALLLLIHGADMNA